MLNDFAEYLAAQGVGTYEPDDVGGDIFIGKQPPVPDNCITLYEAEGDPPDLAAPLDRPGMQVIVRHPLYYAGRARCTDVEAKLHGLTEQVFNGTRYLLVKQTGSPIPLGTDKNDRFEWSINYLIIKERS